MKIAVLCAFTAASLASVSVPQASHAANLVYSFNASCQSCSPAGSAATAYLELKNYNFGEQLTPANLVNFYYNSKDIDKGGIESYTGWILSGVLGADTGSYNIQLSALDRYFNGLQYIVTQDFNTQTSGVYSYVFDFASRGVIIGPNGTVSGGPIDHAANSGTGGTWTLISGATATVPEPASWSLMLAGFGMIGSAMRYRRRSLVPSHYAS